MVEESIDRIGGIGQYVKEGNTVVIKGNFFSPAPPPVTVDRRFVQALIRIIKRAKPSKITLCEAVSVGTKMGRLRSTRWIVEELGIMDVVREEGIAFLPLEECERVWVDVPGGKCLQHIFYPEMMYESDVVINMPCMKTHSQTTVTLGLKNYQGILTDGQKYHSHRDDLTQKLVDVMRIRTPDLTIIDGLLAMEGNGSDEAGLPVQFNTIVASNDVVAADAVTSALMGIEDVLDVTTTRLAQFYKLGCADLDKVDIRGKSIEEARYDFLLPTTVTKPYDRYATGIYENIDLYIGGACRECWNQCKNVVKLLGKYPQYQWTVLFGNDPKFPPMGEFKGELKYTVLYGDCACACRGNVRELRNAMLLANEGVIINGCPPFRPAAKILSDYLVELGLQKPAPSEGYFSEDQLRAYAYYKKIDSTWIPKSERNG